MRVVFVALAYGGLSISYLSAVLKKNEHEVFVLFDPMLFGDGEMQMSLLSKIFSYKKILVEEILNLKPDLVAFSVVTDHYKYLSEIAKLIKNKKDIPILFGGIHPTSVPELVIENPFVDIVCVGEGEDAIAELANSFDGSKFDTDIKNLWFKKEGKVIKNDVRPLIKNLDNLPFPDHDQFYSIFFGFRYGYGIIASRGCPFNCTYCNNNVYRNVYGANYSLRRRSVDNVIHELKLAKKKYNPKFIRFHDEVFTSDKGWLKEFSYKYKRYIGLPLFCFVHPHTIDEGGVRLLKSAGCYEVQMGVQTFSDELNRDVLGRNTSIKKIAEVIRLFKKYEIYVVTDNMLGLPKQTSEELHNLCSFYASNMPDRIDVFYLRYYPKLQVNEIAKRCGLLDDEKIDKLERAEDVVTFTRGGDTFSNELSKFQILMYLMTFFPLSVRKYIVRKKLYRFFIPLPSAFARIFSRVFYTSKFDMFRSFMFYKYLYYIPRRLFLRKL